MNYDKLIKAGIDIDSLIKRLMGNASLVKVFIKKFVEDTTFESLKEAFFKGDMHACEMASHTLKGMCGNLSLTRLYALFSEQVNLLRAGAYVKAEMMMEQLTLIYGTTIEQMKACLAE